MPVTTEVRVRYAETDQMGIVYYANYLVWFEIGRVEAAALPGPCLQPAGDRARAASCRWSRPRCRYRSPARYDDQILIETRPALLRGSVLKFAYRILRKAPDGEEPTLLAEGETVHVVCDDQLNKKPLPEQLRRRPARHDEVAVGLYAQRGASPFQPLNRAIRNEIPS